MRTSRCTRRSSAVTVDDVGADLAQPGDGRVERGRVDRLEADATASFAGPACTISRLARVVVAPRVGAGRGRLAGHEPDDVGEDGVEDAGVGHLEDEVAEFDLVVHRVVLLR